MRPEPWHLGFLLIPGLILLHLFTAPFTKVEESFNIQATHDFLNFGLSFKQASARIAAFYDHVKFPGAVPRTFLGALALAGLSNPFVPFLAPTLPQQQLLVRGVLGMLNAASILFYASGVRNAYGKTTALWFTALQASQFHVIFYASRTLPNMFAFAITTFALRFTLPEPATRMSPTARLKLSLYLMALTAVIFRSEVALLLGGYCLQALLPSRSLQQAISTTRFILLPSILTATVAGLLLTVSVDTFMWRSFRLVWPELAAFLSNVLPSGDSKGASAWGTSPWHWYLTSALPRLLPSPLLFALPLLPFLPSTLRHQLSPLLLPTSFYITLYSLLPHKETRFLFPILPPLTTTLALLATYPSIRLSRSRLHQLLTTLLILSTLTTFCISHLVLLPLSSLTYPGAHALNLVHTHADETLDPPRKELRVHLTNLALQTGVTRFLERPVPETPLVYMPGSKDGRFRELRTGGTRWWYDKSGSEDAQYGGEGWWGRFDYVVVESVADVVGGKEEPGEWEVVGEVLGLGRPRVVDGRGIGGGRGGEEDGVVTLLERMYGHGKVARGVVWVYEEVRDVLWKGKGIGGVSLTRGRWVNWVAEPVLVVLARKKGITYPSREQGSRAVGLAARVPTTCH